jgi:hypothetical protein
VVLVHDRSTSCARRPTNGLATGKPGVPGGNKGNISWPAYAETDLFALGSEAYRGCLSAGRMLFGMYQEKGGLLHFWSMPD